MNKYISSIIVMLIILNYYNLNAQAQQNCNFATPALIITPTVTISNPDLTTVIDLDNIPPYEPPTEGKKARIIEWVHGLGGDEYAWLPALNNTQHGSANDSFPARNVKGYTMTYTEGDITMRDCALNVLNDIEDHSLNLSQSEEERKDNMIIAHSQGSIVSRTICMEKEGRPQEQPFGGIAFFTAPHNGGQILISAKNGEGAKFGAWGCNLLLAPKIKETLYNLPGLVKLFLNENVTSNNLTTTICDTLIGKTILKFYIDKTAGQLQTDDYVPNAIHLKKLRSFETNPARQWKTHRINFISEEDDEGYLIWRTLNFQLHPSIRAENFGANKDNGIGTLKWDIDSTQMVYENKAEEFHLAYESYKLSHPEPNPFTGDFGNLVLWFTKHKPKLKNLKTTWDSYENAQEFFDNANNRWKVIIGSRTRKVQTAEITMYYQLYGNEYRYTETLNCSSEEMCTSWAEDWHLHVFPASIPAGATYKYYTLKYNYYSGAWVEAPSDGVVPLKSQAALPDESLPQQRLKGSSHMQMRNDKNLELSLMKLFNGEITTKPEFAISQEWFKTDTN